MTTFAPPMAPVAPAATRRRLLGWRGGSLLALLAGTALAYLWTLSESGYANSFYSAAAQAGSQSWKAWFFGSLDAGNAITVDKPPASLWLMGLSVRIFGMSSWSILVPEALLGVATVYLVFLTVRRVNGHVAGIIAGAATALTPAAALMFRFNNPDAMLLFLLTAAGYVVLRATERASGRLVLLAGVLLGFGFLTKMLQAFLVLPAFALVYLLAAPTGLRKRILHLLGGLAAMVVSMGWWVAIVEIVPASARPYIDGSTDNSILQLAFGYNGLGRLNGNETGGHGNAGFSSGVGVLRLFQGVSGGMVAWLLPAALIVLVAGVVARGRAPRTDLPRAALLMTGLAMLTTGLVFSSMAGIYHDYYTVALAPWIAMTATIGAAILWQRRAAWPARAALAAALAASAIWAFVLLHQSHEQPYDALRWLVLLLGLAGTAALLLPWRRRLTTAVLVGAVLGMFVGPAAYSIDTIRSPHTGSIVTAGPVTSMGFGGGFGGGPGRQGGGRPGSGQNGAQGGFGGGGFPGGGFPGGGTTGGTTGQAGGFPGGGFGGRGGAGGGGGLLDGATVNSQLKSLLTKDASSYTWSAAVSGSQNAASYELATGTSVIAIGGFNSTANGPTLAQFEQWVSEGRIHYYIASSSGFGGRGFGGGSNGGSSGSSSSIEQWVTSHYTAQTVGSSTVYDLTQPSTSTAATSTTTGDNT
ncbi:glycosyltransferase family 39 protein [Nocardioides sp. BP30]|uniref:glycosyltransferase family 39 protein n=1 Tax=Nocardioides sp. BP30 TaxID=3036374 RepID=UPI0024697AC5|nr:glycosyltransferase family 39 protein [Nocardioides sp. BP30]WGL51744.1 glycosyltransferase family 39 protein [Nocardioides sp. BP30]